MTSFNTSSPKSTDVTTTTPIPPSPRTIANAAVAEAIAERARLADENSSLQSEELRGTKRPSSSRDASPDPDTRRMRLSETDGDDSRYEQVTKALFDAIDGLVQEGLQGFHKHESVARNLELAKEELDSKDREIQRLRANEESSRDTIMVSRYASWVDELGLQVRKPDLFMDLKNTESSASRRNCQGRRS